MRLLSMILFVGSVALAAWALTPIRASAQAGCTGGCHEVTGLVWRLYYTGYVLHEFDSPQGTKTAAVGPSEGDYHSTGGTIGTRRCGPGTPFCPIGWGDVAEGSGTTCTGAFSQVTERECTPNP